MEVALTLIILMLLSFSTFHLLEFVAGICMYARLGNLLATVALILEIFIAYAVAVVMIVLLLCFISNEKKGLEFKLNCFPSVFSRIF
ncbi:MAG: hypothetical protein DRJ60_00125 [Thermoprotei archaeon]|nr:MAG: hypothetical protein DRJ60_00125 [Thermoprotei archaeon]